MDILLLLVFSGALSNVAFAILVPPPIVSSFLSCFSAFWLISPEKASVLNLRLLRLLSG